MMWDDKQMRAGKIGTPHCTEIDLASFGRQWRRAISIVANWLGRKLRRVEE
jgi:hypothetical protein